MIEAPKQKARDPRNGLRMSATMATIFTLLGHTVFGFEQPWSQLFVALGVGYATALLFEWVDALPSSVAIRESENSRPMRAIPRVRESSRS